MKHIKKTKVILLSLTTIFFLLFGCQEAVYSKLEIGTLTNPPKPAEINEDGPSSMSVGISIGISAKPISNSDENFTVGDELELLSQNEDVLLVAPASMNGAFILTSISVGQTCVDVIINGSNKGCLEVEVTQ